MPFQGVNREIDASGQLAVAEHHLFYKINQLVGYDIRLCLHPEAHSQMTTARSPRITTIHDID